MRMKPKPGEPTAKEIEEHRITHVPYRAWCEDCVFGKCVEAAHRRGQSAEELGANTVVIDYGYLTEKPKNWVETEGEEKTEADCEEEAQSKGMPILVMRHRATKYMTAHIVPRKVRACGRLAV